MEIQQGEAAGREEASQRDREARVTALALRYRSGDHAALGELHAALEPMIHGVVRSHLSASRPLPAGVEPEDLYQQAYVALAESALEWQPNRQGNFVPYLLRSFPWRIDRYLRSQTPSRRTTRLRLYSMPHDALMDCATEMVGLDGRDWDDGLVCSELLGGLPRLYGQVVRLHLYHGLPFAEVARTLGIGRSAAHEAFTRAISLLRSFLATGAGPEKGKPKKPAPRQEGVDAASLRRCLEALRRLAPQGAPLPGREVVCREAGLTWREYRGIMARLCSLGYIVGRRRGSAGSLAEEMERCLR